MIRKFDKLKRDDVVISPYTNRNLQSFHVSLIEQASMTQSQDQIIQE